MQWSRELIECCRLNVDETIFNPDIFVSPGCIHLVANTISLLQKRGMHVDGMIFSPAMYYRIMKSNFSQWLMDDFNHNDIFDSFCLFGVSSIACDGDNENNGVLKDTMYVLCDFFDKDRSRVVKCVFGDVI